ncbi:MAG TPA: ABC transporter ATP-binding protein [Clostridia bacterium]|nr:ABC transporter ATP-binding protein [Clostridia bacterium]
MEAVLKINNLNKWFGKKKIIDDLSIEVYAGEVFGFLGPNGAGKTTTIKMIMGFLDIDSGEILINGINLRKNFEKAMSKIGGIVENPEMYKDISGLTNLKMYARLQNNISNERINEVVRLVGMENRIHEKVKKYSLGMKQRIGLAQAILHRPKILILDEPTNGLDPAGIKELRDILKNLAHNENVAVFVSSHLLSEMELMCDRVGIINNGKLLGVKTIEEMQSQASGGITVYRFTVKPVEKALELVRVEYSDKIKAITEDHLDIAVDSDDVMKINALFAANAIGITGVAKIETSLEDAFMNITGGGNIIG